MNVITTDNPNGPSEAARILASLAKTAFDPVVRGHIAAATASAINSEVPIHLRPTGQWFPALKPLRSNGVVRLTDCLSPAAAAQAREYFARRAPGPDGYACEDVLDAPGLVEAITPLLLNTLREYFEAPATLLSARVWWSEANASAGFRRDRSDIKTARLVIYLTDVAADNGADEYILGSADLQAVLTVLQQRGIERSTVKRIFAPADSFSPDEIVSIFTAQRALLDGAAGSGFLSDGYGLYREGRIARGRRLAFEAVFGLMPPAGTHLQARDMETLSARLNNAPLAHYAFRLARQTADGGVSRAMPAASAPATRLVAKLNDQISRSERAKTISVVRDPFITKNAKIFTIGSCFAVEIRKALAARGFDVYPKYRDIPFDPNTQSLAKLPSSDNINHYTTFSIRQEFEVAFGERTYEPDNFWQVPLAYSHLKAPSYVQAPYRKQIYATDMDAAADLNGKLDDCISTGIHQADVIIVTLGLIETWLNLKDGLVVATAPYDASDSSLARFHLSTYAENYANLKKICDLVLGHYPGKRLVFTVSPVALGTTYSGNDVIVANTESKSVLRAAAGQIVREYPSVRYWPSFEIANAHDIREADGSHVTREGVKMIMDAFLAAHCEDTAGE